MDDGLAGAGVSDPADPYQRPAQTFPRLTAEEIARAIPFGTVEALTKGTRIFRHGDPAVDFFVVLEGAVEVCQETLDGPAIFVTHQPSEFTGDLDLFNDRESLVTGRMGADGRVLRIRRAAFRRLLVAEPELGERIMRAFILRRVGLMNHAQSSAVVIGVRGCGDTLRMQRFLGRNGYPVRTLEPDDPEAQDIVAAHRLTLDDLPLVALTRTRVLRNPTNRELALATGIAEPLDPRTVYDVAIVGAGPAGLAAAVYAASEGLRTVVLESEAPGGQAGTSSKIENYLGFPTGISGQALAGRAQVQAQKFGARLVVPRRVERLQCDDRPFVLHLEDGEQVRSRAVVVASGARYRSLGVADAARFEGNGIHYAATRLEAGLCEREEVAIVGGGNSAGQAAVFLSRHAAHVHVLCRGPALAASMSEYLIGRIVASERITLHVETEIVALAGMRHLEQVTWRHAPTGREETRPVGNVFLMLGAVPNTEWLRGCLDLDAHGFVRTPDGFGTSRRGVFAVGDVRAGSVKRVAAGVGEGSVVVAAIHQWLAEG